MRRTTRPQSGSDPLFDAEPDRIGATIGERWGGACEPRPFSFGRVMNMEVVRKIGRVLCVLGFFALVVAALLWGGQEENAGSFDVSHEYAPQESAQTEPQRRIDWEALPETIVAWVEVPGTSIDEPIAQATPGAPNVYLYEDALGQGAYGTPYIDCECSLESDFAIVYGHHMSDGSVFADFARFSDEVYAQEHGRIIVYERSGIVRELQVVAADVVNASTERLVIPTREGFGNVLQDCDLVLADCQPERLWAFATCSYQTANSRTVVYACEASVLA